MSAPLSPRTEAILRAVEQPSGVDVASVVDELDRNAPDDRWPALPLTDRRATVRRYLGRMVDDGRVVRLDEGVFVRTWLSRSTYEHNQALDERGMTDQRAGHNPTAPTDSRSPEPQPQMISTQEGTPMTEPTSARTASPDLEHDTHPLFALLDNCPAGPWPRSVHDRLSVVEELEHRRTELTARRDAALRAADAAEAAESEAIVDGDDTGTHAAAAATQRATAAQLDRALATLDIRRRAAALDVLAAQQVELLGRARAARSAVAVHWQRREELLGELAEHDGNHWPSVAGEHVDRSRTHALRSAADRAARLVAAVRATLDDLPLGFLGSGAQRVTAAGVGTLAGVGGVEPLVETMTLGLHDHGRDTTEIVEEIEQELAQTPMP